jgi:hypothetical protein
MRHTPVRGQSLGGFVLLLFLSMTGESPLTCNVALLSAKR